MDKVGKKAKKMVGNLIESTKPKLDDNWSDMDEIEWLWSTFQNTLDRLLMDDPETHKGKAISEEIIKPYLQEILDILLEEDQVARINRDLGECL